MTDRVTQQKGASTSTPSAFVRYLTSKIVTKIASDAAVQKARKKAEARRQKQGRRHVVEYFHQADDGYSQIAVQMLPRLAERYDVNIICHLVTASLGNNAPEPELLAAYAHRDAAKIAPYYGLEAPKACPPEALTDLQNLYGGAGQGALSDRLEAGNRRRQELGHYSGAMFFYEGEWYGGVDRLYHLEKRLASLGADTRPWTPLVAPRPLVEIGRVRDQGRLTLEFYPSLRSPYTAIVFDRVVRLAEDTGVKLVVKPVLPMVMRGVPVTRVKGIYIFKDAAREARDAGVAYGNFYDPIGDPVIACYSLYPWAVEQGKGNALISAFLKAAFVLGINTNRRCGMKKVVDMAGLEWAEACVRMGRDDNWQDMLEENRRTLYQAGLWGVPSFRLLDEKGAPVLALWGQDRLWLVAREIKRLITDGSLISE
ncbi:MAG: 2-hydroxychromene-2-carboxylate isomerase [Alphaproteobacteria bacterium]|nr:MAG: 2-hydroxychromene-2-carboxylate isomerase [Alphaproteobacteria bacterium]